MVATNLRFEVNLNLEVHCQKPYWVQHIKDYVLSQSVIDYPVITHFSNIIKYSRYRIYVNDDLITERNWIWDNNTYLKESIWIQTEKDQNNVVRLEPALENHQRAQFRIDNLSVKTHTLSELYQVDDLTVNFRVDKYIDTQLESQQ
jgi:hypothetical protein